MDIKQLLKQAIDAKIGGDTQGFTEAMKQVMAAKVGRMVSEMSDQFADGVPQEEDGEYQYHLEEYDYNGTLVDAHLNINIGHYQAATQGNYSPVASDPSEYHGDPEELEWYVVSADLIMEDGTEKHLSGDEAANLTFNAHEQERIDDFLLNKMQSDADDDVDYDSVDRGYDY